MPGAPFGTIAVWGDGAVGTGLSVALSRVADVVLVGPPGSPGGRATIRSSGAVQGRARVGLACSDDPPRSDMAFVAVKTYHLEAVSRAMRRASTGPVACLCNGMGLERFWGAGWDLVERVVVVGGFRLVARRAVETHPGGLLALEGGKAAGPLGAAGLDVSTRPGMEPSLWAKWLVNSTLNPVAALSGSTNRDLRGRGLERILWILFDELAGVVPPEFSDEAKDGAREMLGMLMAMSDNRCSMLEDLENGRPTEIDCLTGLACGNPSRSLPVAEAVTALVRARTSRA